MKKEVACKDVNFNVSYMNEKQEKHIFNNGDILR